MKIILIDFQYIENHENNEKYENLNIILHKHQKWDLVKY